MLLDWDSLLLAHLVCDLSSVSPFFSCNLCVFYFILQISLVFAVAVDADGSPVTVSCSGDARRNIIVWIDHRSVKQAEKINSFNSTVLQYCGGSVSPEMQPPKVLDELRS